MEFATVPGSDALLAKRRARYVWHVSFAEHRVGPIGAPMQRFAFRHGIGDCVEIGRRIFTGTVVEVVRTGSGGCCG